MIYIVLKCSFQLVWCYESAVRDFPSKSLFLFLTLHINCDATTLCSLDLLVDAKCPALIYISIKTDWGKCSSFGCQRHLKLKGFDDFATLPCYTGLCHYVISLHHWLHSFANLMWISLCCSLRVLVYGKNTFDLLSISEIAVQLVEVGSIGVQTGIALIPVKIITLTPCKLCKSLPH